MNRKKHILLLSPFFRPNVGGIETHLSDLVDYLSNRGIFTHIITYQPLTKKEKGKRIENGKKYHIRRLNWFGYNLFYKLENYPVLEFLYLFPYIFLYSLYYLLINRQINVIYGNGMISNLMAVVLSKLFGKKNITSVHTYYRLSDKKSTFHNTSKITSWIFNNSDAIFVLQKAAKQDIINLGVNPTKIIILNYWIDTNLFKPMDKKKIRKEFGISGDFVALFVARLVDVKGVDLIAEVAEKASDDITFVFVGDGPKRDVVEKVAKKNNVYFLGFMPLSEMPKIFNIGDVLLWGSIDEDFVGITTRNALSCGLPVISSNEAVFFNIKRKTDKRSFPEEIFHITEPKAAEIIDVLKEIKNSKKKLISASKKSREYAIKMYGIKNAEIIYNKIIELCKPT